MSADYTDHAPDLGEQITAAVELREEIAQAIEALRPGTFMGAAWIAGYAHGRECAARVAREVRS